MHYCGAIVNWFFVFHNEFCLMQTDQASGLACFKFRFVSSPLFDLLVAFPSFRSSMTSAPPFNMNSGSPDPTSSPSLPSLDLHLKSKSFLRAFLLVGFAQRKATARAAVVMIANQVLHSLRFLAINARVPLLFPLLIQ
jgi:hypothetical protein